jgi:hypothetical protein
VFAKREFVDTVVSLPFGKAAPKITFSAARRLVSFLSSLGQQLQDNS